MTNLQTKSSKRGPFDTVILFDKTEDSMLEVAPSRGGIVVRARIRGREILYLDEATLLDVSKNVRGGIPICFPIAGKLSDDRASFGGKEIVLSQHGFARRSKWNVVDAGETLTIQLVSNPETRAVFPFEFDIRVTYSIHNDSLGCETTIINTGSETLPVHLGFHPYFYIPEDIKSEFRVEAAASRAFNNRTGEHGSYEPPRFGAEEVDYHILDPAGGAVRLRAPKGKHYSYRLDYGGFPCAVLWTLPGKDFICLEPWTAPAGALATGEGLIQLLPNHPETRSWYIQIES
ncbi:MAG: aldose epimerase [Planctomycetota bacterium]